MVISEDPWHSHLLLSAYQWSCHYLFLWLRSVLAGIRTPNLLIVVPTLWPTAPSQRSELKLTMFCGKHESSSDLPRVLTYLKSVSDLPWVCVILTQVLCHTYPASWSDLSWVCVILTLGLCHTYPESWSDLSWVCLTYPDAVSDLPLVSVRLNLNLPQTHPEMV